MSFPTLKPIVYGSAASIALLSVYFVATSLISEPGFAREQFLQYWYFVVSLAVGFGIQVGLYMRLKVLVRNSMGSGKVLGLTGTTSTIAMVSCCTHYLANLLPILGVVGLATFVAQYQTEFFWVGILFNIFGIAFIAIRISKFKQRV